MERTFTLLGALLMFLAVGLGAFGAHALRAPFAANPRLSEIYETAVRYHMIHALAMLFVAWATTRWPVPPANWSGYLFLVGIILFSGSLYLLSLGGPRWLGAITPLGGLAFLAGWLSLLLAAWRG